MGRRARENVVNNENGRGEVISHRQAQPNSSSFSDQPPHTNALSPHSSEQPPKSEAGRPQVSCKTAYHHFLRDLTVQILIQLGIAGYGFRPNSCGFTDTGLVTGLPRSIPLTIQRLHGFCVHDTSRERLRTFARCTSFRLSILLPAHAIRHSREHYYPQMLFQPKQRYIFTCTLVYSLAN